MSNPFITADAAEYIDLILNDQIRALVDSAGGKIPMAAIEAATGILCHNDPAQPDKPNHYSRVWQILRRDYLERCEPALLVDSAKLLADGLAQAMAANEEAAWRTPARKGELPNGEMRVLGPVVTALRNQELCSWGEINVRLGLPESRIRKAYGGKKDLGTRIGKGGRFAYDDPTLYLEHRRVEGAHIPADKVGRPKPEELLNFAKDEAKVAKPRTKKAVAKAS